MGGNVKFHGLSALRLLALVGLTLPLLVTPSVRAGLSGTSPVEFEIFANPSVPDEVAIRGTTTRSSTGGGDAPIGVVGRATGSALGTDSDVGGVGAIATGDASGFNSEVHAIIARATGNATGVNTEVVGIRAAVTGTPTGQDSDVTGVVGTADATSGDAEGVRGRSNSINGTGVVGVARATSGLPPGVSELPPTGVRGVARATSGLALGVIGLTFSPDGQGVRGQNLSTSGGVGLLGESFATSGFPIGVLGQTPNSPEGVGVLGLSFSTSGGTGVLGRGPFRGTVGQAQATSGFTIGVEGQDFSPDGSGIFGRANSTSGPARGVVGETLSSSGIGVHGRALATSGNPIAVWGESPTSNGIGVQGSSAPGGLAGLFNGKVQINCSTPPCLKINTTSVGDLAENLPMVALVAPGDVVVLAEGRGGYGVAPASRPYDTRVAGIVSAHPPVLLQNHQQQQAAPVAMVGIVRAKATVANGAIRVGELLTTSRIPGHLMRCPTALRCVGAVVGKALEPLEKGEKQILVMLWRQ